MSGRQEPESSATRSFDASQIVRRSSSPALAIDENDRILALNRAAEQLLGHAAESVVGRHFHQLIEPRDIFGNRVLGQGIHQMVRDGEPIRAFEVDARSASGSRVRVRVSVLPVLGPEPWRYRLVYHLIPRKRRPRAEEAIDLLLKHRDELGRSAGAPDRAEDVSGRSRLTGREKEVLRLLADGRDTAEIAEALHISVNTVRSHSRNILRKLGAHSRAEAISVAFHRGLL